jgi:hypothetical protein
MTRDTRGWGRSGPRDSLLRIYPSFSPTRASSPTRKPNKEMPFYTRKCLSIPLHKCHKGVDACVGAWMRACVGGCVGAWWVRGACVGGEMLWGRPTRWVCTRPRSSAGGDRSGFTVFVRRGGYERSLGARHLDNWTMPQLGRGGEGTDLEVVPRRIERW